jgi:polyisoprenoid-binding protein YceI
VNRLAILALMAAALTATAQRGLADPYTVEIDLDQSFIAVKTYKGGMFSFFAGHDHGILAREWAASVCYDPETPRNSSVDIAIPVAALEIDTPEARRAVGLEDNGPSAEDRASLQEKMVGPEILSAQVYPEISFRTTTVHEEADGLALAGPLRIRGQIRVQVAHARVEKLDGGAVQFTGVMEVKQSSYGIEPVSIARLVTVKDAMEIHFRVQGRRGGSPCERLTALHPR